MELNGPIVLVLGALTLGYVIAPPIERGLKKAAHVTCRVATLGFKCRPPAPPDPPPSVQP